jgi:hypothetical protein
MGQLESWALNIRWLVGFLILLAILLVLFIAALTAFKIWLWRARQAFARRQQYHAAHGPDGQPYPPTGRGLCDRCQRAFPNVYYLPSGQRLCHACYGALHPSDAPHEPRPT